MQDIRTLGANYTTLRVSTQVGSLADMLDNPHHKDELLRLGLRPSTVFACGIDFLLALRPEALAPFQAELQARACMLTIAPLAVFYHIVHFWRDTTVGFGLLGPWLHRESGCRVTCKAPEVVAVSGSRWAIIRQVEGTMFQRGRCVACAS